MLTIPLEDKIKISDKKKMKFIPNFSEEKGYFSRSRVTDSYMKTKQDSKITN